MLFAEKHFIINFHIWESSVLQMAYIITNMGYLLHFSWSPWALTEMHPHGKASFMAKRRTLTSALLLPCLEHSTALISSLKSLLFTPSHRSVDSICKARWNLWQQAPLGWGRCSSAFSFYFFLFWGNENCSRLLLWPHYSPLLFLFFSFYILFSHPVYQLMGRLSDFHPFIQVFTEFYFVQCTAFLELLLSGVVSF